MISSNVKKFILRPLFNNLTAGESIQSLQTKIEMLEKNNLYPIVDYIRESSVTTLDVNNSISQYIRLSNIPKVDYVGLKLSSINFHENKIDFLVNLLTKKNKKVMIDAEDVDKQDKIDEITDDLIQKYNKHEICVYKTYQMYRKDGLNKLLCDINTIQNLGVKLVKGAYYKQDRNSNKLFTTKEQTDVAYTNAMKLIFNDIKHSNTHVFICTHNLDAIHLLLHFIENNKKLSHKLAHASLYGFINNHTITIKDSGIKTYKYLPYGNFDDSIPYLLRRIYENPFIMGYLLK
jgi:ASC-1-like (ASCH) protein